MGAEWGRLIADVGLQDGIGPDDVVAFCLGATAVLTFLGIFLRPLWREVRDFLEWSKKFRQDWDGEASRDGRDKIPGVMERLNRIDGEFQRNGGATMKDSQFRTERALRRIEMKQAVADEFRVEVMDAAEKNLTLVRDALADAGHEVAPAVPFPPLPAIISDIPEEGHHGSDRDDRH